MKVFTNKKGVKTILLIVFLVSGGTCIQEIHSQRRIMDFGENDGRPIKRTYYRDYDGDGYGNSSYYIVQSYQPKGYVRNSSDCNDRDARIHPWGTEKCGDGIDNNCNKSVDEGCPVSMPRAVIITNNCGYSRLTRSNPPRGVTWYWQSSATGTSTSSSWSSITRTTGSVYYLRARNNSSGKWSPARIVNYSIKSLPSIPPEPIIYYSCGQTTLTITRRSPGGITWYWQSSPSGTSTSNSSNIVRFKSGSVYYLRARNNSSGCWSSTRTINYSVKKTIPSIPSQPTVVNSCGSTKITRGTPPSGVTWYWQSSSKGTSTSNSNSSITRTSGTTYYLRARNNSSGCWSFARTVTYSVKSVPSVPSLPTVVNNCGSSVLTRSTPPSGVTWYWQSSSGGTSTSNSSSSITRTSGSAYYLRARNNSSGCWSSARTVSYSIKPAPIWYKDADGDAFGDPKVTKRACTQPSGYVSNHSDCDDSKALYHPNTKWYADTDGDTFGDPSFVKTQCIQPSGYVLNNTDACPTIKGEKKGCKKIPYSLPKLSNENYVFTRVYQKPMTKSVDDLDSFKDLFINDFSESIM